MNNLHLQMIMPLVQQYLGKELNALRGVYDAVGYALPRSKQEFVTTQYNTLEPFLRSPQGKEALVFFVESWQDSLKPPKPAEIPPPVVTEEGTPQT